MKLLGASIATAFLLLGGPSQATVWDISAVLSGTQEVPPNGSTATGSVSGTLDDVTNTFTWMVQYSALTGGGAIGGHFHQGPVGVNGGVLLGFTDQIIGQSTASANGIWVMSDAEEALLLSSGIYANIHTPEFMGGEIRGQLAPVPEPETWLMLVLGALGVGAAARRRRQAFRPG